MKMILSTNESGSLQTQLHMVKYVKRISEICVPFEKQSVVLRWRNMLFVFFEKLGVNIREVLRVCAEPPFFTERRDGYGRALGCV